MNNTRNEALVATVGTRIREVRNQKGMSMDDLADECQIEKKLVYLIENGKGNPTISTLDVIAKAFGMSVSELLKGI